MKKLKFLGTAVLAASLLFAGCSSPEVDDPTSGKSNPSPAPTKYKEYIVGAPEGAINALSNFQDWQNGSKYTDNPDGSITVTSGSAWNFSLANLAYGDIPAGYLARFDRVVTIVDDSNFTATEVKVLFAGSGDDPVVVTPIEEDGFSKYVANISDFTKAETSTQVALQFMGTGTVTVKQLWLEADTQPEIFKTPLTSLITSATELKDNVTVGTEGGQYPQDSYDAFVAAIEAANAVASKASVTQSEINAAVLTLAKAKLDFEATKIASFPFTLLSGIEIPNDATVLFKSSDAANSVFATAAKQTWWNNDGSLAFSIKNAEFDSSNTIIEVVTQGSSCGAFGDMVQTLAAGQKLVISYYSANGLKYKPVAPDVEFVVEGKAEWQVFEYTYESASNLSQLGFVGNGSADPVSVFIDAVYIK